MKKIQKLHEQLSKDLGQEDIDQLKRIARALDDVRVLLQTKEALREVSIKNFPIPKELEFPKEIRVSNFPKTEEYPTFPNEIEVREPKWYERFPAIKLFEIL